MSTAIYYGSSTGNTEEIAGKISEALGGIDSYDVSTEQGISSMSKYDKIIIATSTWGDGDLQDDWDEVWEDFTELDLADKTIAIVGIGDQDSYSDSFVNAIHIVYDHVSRTNAKVVGFTSTDGYDFENEAPVVNGQFVGLVIDEDNQEDLTDERISNWVENIKADIL